MSLNVCIFGVSGYTGSKLLYYLCNHKKVKIVGVFGYKTAGIKLECLFPKINNLPKISITNYEKFDFKNVDLIFSCLPHGEFQKKIFKNLDKKISIIDLSGDFRLESKNEYEKFYNIKHDSFNDRSKFVYGLSEINREKISKTKFVCNPGCYPTSILIPIIPLLKNNVLTESILVDSKSGVSGAGKNLSENYLFSELQNNFYSYGINSHKHLPEIKQEIKKLSKNVSVTFIPHLLPIFSGIQSNIYLGASKHSVDEIEEIIEKYYCNDIFIKILKKGIPKINDVQNTNNVLIKIFSDYEQNKIVIISCIDNLVKGAAGQAIQNMNIMFGLDETESLI